MYRIEDDEKGKCFITKKIVVRYSIDGVEKVDEIWDRVLLVYKTNGVGIKGMYKSDWERTANIVLDALNADLPKAVAQIEVDGKMVELFDDDSPHTSASG